MKTASFSNVVREREERKTNFPATQRFRGILRKYKRSWTSEGW